MSNPEPKWINHDKHKKHPLKEVYKHSQFECKICKTQSRGTRFRCDECDFNVHSTCATCPDSLSSFTHPKHMLQLMNTPFLDHKCHLCEKPVKGMVYRCKSCGFFMHPSCREYQEVMFNQPIHPPHSLKFQLMESSKCDVCEKSCKKWRYYCEICNVHIHVGCFSGKSGDDDDDYSSALTTVKVVGGIVDVVANLSG